MLSQKLPYRITSMPTCSINIQPDSVAAKLAIKVLQYLEESLAVASFRLDHSCTTKKRSHPAGDIQAFLVLAGCRNLQPLSQKRPSAAKPWMKGKTAFVLKNNGFFRTQRFEFFLGFWRISSRLLPLLEDKHDWPALTDTQVDASNIGLGGLSVLHRTAAVNELPKWGRPNGPGSIQTFGVIPPGDVPTALQSSASCGLDGLTVFSGAGLLRRPCLPHESSDLHSSGSVPKPLRSNPVAAPPEPKGGWLSLCQSRLPALSRRGPAIALWTPFQDLSGRFSCLPV
jgi:hypothetical protein